jgi:hypothetical protein
MIINIRGTSGAGKSTLARRVMELYPSVVRNQIAGRKRPVSLILSGAGNARPLYVLGHYDIPCGGSDTVVNREFKFGLLREAAAQGMDVLFEGVVDSDEVSRTVTFPKDQLRIIMLTTPIEVCLDRIRERREAKGNEKPLSEVKTRFRKDVIIRACNRLKVAGVHVERLDTEAAFLRIKEWLGL